MRFKQRHAIGREHIIARILTAVSFAVFVLYIVPHINGNLANLTLIFLAGALIVDALARVLAGKSEWYILIPAAVIVLAVSFFFYVSGGLL